jgi:hypothetical protein
MPNLQTLFNESENSTPATTAPGPERICKGSGEIDWYRTDWGRAAGVITSFAFERRTHVSGSLRLDWGLVEISTMYLSHKAALLLLQGQKLSDILIPNHELRRGANRITGPLAHVLLRVDSWKYWQSRPALTGLKLAHLREIPDGLSSAEVLEILVAGSVS